MPDEITITPAPSDGGYTKGCCSWTGKRSVDMIVTAVGRADGHGVRGNGEGDLYHLEQLVPDAGERERVMDVARRVMRHRQFKAVRDALRTKLQFRDVLHRDEIERIVSSVRPEVLDGQKAGARGGTPALWPTTGGPDPSRAARLNRSLLEVELRRLVQHRIGADLDADLVRPLPPQ